MEKGKLLKKRNVKFILYRAQNILKKGEVVYLEPFLPVQNVFPKSFASFVSKVICMRERVR